MDKDSPRTTAEELQKIVVSGPENRKTKKSNSPYTSPNIVWEGSKKNDPSSSENKLQHIQLSDTTGTSNGTDIYGQIKQKKLLFSSKHSRWV